MLLFKRQFRRGDSLAFIADLPEEAAPDGMDVAALREMDYVARTSGPRAFWALLARALEDETVSSVAVSLNRNCVLDDELPARLQQAAEAAAGDALWAVLAATGKCIDGNTYSVVYPSAAPRVFACNIPRPLVDCGLELFLVHADFLRSKFAQGMRLDMPPEYFPQWCILAGYLDNRVSVFRPELAIGVNGAERGRDASVLASILQREFADQFPDDTLPSLVGNIPLARDAGQSRVTSERSPRETMLLRASKTLAIRVQQAMRPAVTSMSLSVVTRTRFTRDHLLRRMLTSVTRARQQQDDLAIEIVLSTDVDESDAREAHRALQADFPHLELTLQINQGRYPHSRVDNLIGGILAATRDYVAVVDDDDFVDVDAFDAISDARFLGRDPLLLMSSQVRDEIWRETSSRRWILESSVPGQIYRAENVRRMFLGSNQLPICAMVAPRAWLQRRLETISLRHDLSEDYAIYLALLTAPDLPSLLVNDSVFCLISSRADGSNTITMRDRRPWVRDITLFLHDLFVSDPAPGAGVIQILAQAAKVPPPLAGRFNEVGADSNVGRQSREIAMLRSEVAYLRDVITALESSAREGMESPDAAKTAETVDAKQGS